MAHPGPRACTLLEPSPRADMYFAGCCVRSVAAGLLLTSGLSTLNKDQIAERGARMARRDD